LNSAKQVPLVLKSSRHETFFIILICIIAAVAALGGYLIGHAVTRDAFIDKISRQNSLEAVTLISAGTSPVSLLQVLGKGIDDPLTAKALANMYGVPSSSTQRDLADRLNRIDWLPPYQPAPFVGHMARPFWGDSLRINAWGFRDERQSYMPKPERTVRVFISGGSTAFGSGASSQQQTISYLLERSLAERISPATGYRYEVINAAFPAWSTTQERLLIEQRLVDLKPDAVIMFSGNNDVHWGLHGYDIRWFYSYMDQNYMTMLNEIYKAGNHAEWTFAMPQAGAPIECSTVADLAARNVEESAHSLLRVGGRLIFALQPNIVSSAKRMSEYETRILRGQNIDYWNSCYDALRDSLGRIKAPNYQLMDLSRLFGSSDNETEIFVDSYHFSDQGHRAIAQALVDRIEWNAIVSPDNGPRR
jgi:lysophospholipase L1-like esterase